MPITIEEIRKNKVLALSWKEPYGSLMLHGKVETRRWKTNYRGLVLLCASKKGYYYDAVKSISGKQLDRAITYYQTHHTITLRNNYDYRGNAFAVARLVACRPMKPEDEEKTFVTYYPDLYCHVYEDVTPIVPFPWKGKQGWTAVSDEVKNKIILKK